VGSAAKNKEALRLAIDWAEMGGERKEKAADI
jgi:hypothetical protein